MAKMFLADFTNNGCALYVVGKYFDSPVPSREFWYQISRDYYDWLMSPEDTPRPPGLACPAAFDRDSTVPYVVVHVHFLTRLANPDQPDGPDFGRVGSVNLRWSKAVDPTHLKKGGDVAAKLTTDQLLFLASWSGCVRTGRLNNPYSLPAQPGAIPKILTKEDTGGGGRNVTGRHSLVKDPPGTLGYGWRQIDVVEFSTREFARGSVLLREFEKVYELPERVCCFDDDVVHDRFRIKIDCSLFPEDDPPGYTRRIWRSPTAQDPTPNDVLNPPYFTDVRRTVGYKATSLGWEYKDATKAIPSFSEPLPPHGHLGAKVEGAIAPEGLRKLLMHAEAERARLSRDKIPLNYAEYRQSIGKWQSGRFVPAKESQAKWANRGCSASVALCAHPRFSGWPHIANANSSWPQLGQRWAHSPSCSHLSCGDVCILFSFCAYSHADSASVDAEYE